MSSSSSPRRPITLLTSAPIGDLLPLSPPSSSSSSSTNFLSSSTSSHQLKLQLTPPTPTTPISSWPQSPSSAFTRRSYSPSPSHIQNDDQLRGTLPTLIKASLRSLLSSSLLVLLSSRNDDDDEEDYYEEDEDGGILPSHCSSKRRVPHRPFSRGFRRTRRMGRSSAKLVTILVFWVCFVLWVTALMGVETIFE